MAIGTSNGPSNHMAQVILFNKPYGVLCHFGAPGEGGPSAAASGAPSLQDFLPQRDVYPAGRLDADSEGLVVLTADGALQHRIAEPQHKLPKVYYAEVEGVPGEDALARLRAGIQLKDGKTRPAGAELVWEPEWLWARVPPVRFRRHIPTSWVQITVVEGKNRQVRRMTAAAGFPTLRLIRYSVGEWTLEGLANGAWAEAPVPENLASAAKVAPKPARAFSPSRPGNSFSRTPRSTGAPDGRRRSATPLASRRSAPAAAAAPRPKRGARAASPTRSSSARPRVSTGRARRR
jgi:23S rRNA pseudouridine2457 synthase